MNQQDKPTREMINNAPNASELSKLCQATLSDCKKTWESEKRKVEESSSSQTVASRIRVQRLNNLIKNSDTKNSLRSEQMLNIAQAFSNVLNQRKKK